MTATPKPRRPWFQFGLRTLLLMVTIASAGFGWLGVKVRQVHRQRAAVEAIRKLGGEVLYDYEVDSKGHRVQSPIPPGPACLRELAGDDFFANVVYVSLYYHANAG